MPKDRFVYANHLKNQTFIKLYATLDSNNVYNFKGLSTLVVFKCGTVNKFVTRTKWL